MISVDISQETTAKFKGLHVAGADPESRKLLTAFLFKTVFC